MGRRQSFNAWQWEQCTIAEASRVHEGFGRFFELVAQGDNAAAIRALESIDEHTFPRSTWITYYAFAGDRENVLEWLDQAFRDHFIHLSWALADPALDPFRSEPRIVELRQSIGLEP